MPHLHFLRLQGSLPDMDGDVDVHRRSTGGCIPLLLAMARQGRSNAELGAILMEQEVHQPLETTAFFSGNIWKYKSAHKGAPAYS